MVVKDLAEGIKSKVLKDYHIPSTNPNQTVRRKFEIEDYYIKKQIDYNLKPQKSESKERAETDQSNK